MTLTSPCRRAELPCGSQVYIAFVVADKPKSKRPRQVAPRPQLDELVRDAIEPGDPESPLEFVQRRMRELAKGEKKRP